MKNPTVLTYLTNMDCYSAAGRVLEVIKGADSVSVIVDGTIFYPQGGGQACDAGTIESPEFHFKVDAVTLVDGIVRHDGRIIRGVPVVGAEVTLCVDPARRIMNSRLQSGGHLILNAVRDSGRALIAKKGYHFADGPYVEFSGDVPEQERESLRVRLQSEIDRLVQSNLPIICSFVNPSELASICRSVPPNVPTDRPCRVVTIDNFSQPCGGTHVLSSGELTGLVIGKIRSKKGDTRISYSFN